MKYYSTATTKRWLPTRPEGSGVGDQGGAATPQSDSQFISTLVQVLQAENLAILAGLGTSLGVRGPQGMGAPTMQDLWRAAEEEGGKKFLSLLETVRYRSGGPESNNVEALLSQCHLAERYDPRAEVADFVKKVEAAVVRRCSFVGAETPLLVHEAFLRKIARRPTHLPRTKLFTTNYDLCFEVAASHTRFVVVDGFSHTSPQEFDGLNFTYDLVRRDGVDRGANFIPNVFHLYKLHGSVDWESTRDGRVLRCASPARPLLIYPRSTKFEASYEQPFLEMMSRWQMTLREFNSALLIVGFGFNDAHIAQPVLSALRANVGLRAVFVDPVFETSRRPMHQQLREWIDAGDSRLTLVAGTFAELVEELPDLVAVTDDEKHMRRLGKN